MNSTDAQPESDSQAGQADPNAPDHTEAGRPPAGQPTLVRPLENRMLAGVAAGIANYLDVDVTIVRIILVVLAFAGGAGVPAYLAGWLLIPSEGTEHSIASDLASSLQARSY